MTSRYHRQMLLPGIGEEGQRRLSEAHALIVGCGALGTVIADTLTRAGVGRLSIVDRDTVELTNLQRQVLFDESDVANATPKAEAAKAKIARINSEVSVEAVVADFNFTNAERIAEAHTGADLILDGLDNFHTRYLVNDLAVKRELPYFYGGAVGVTGMAMSILPASDATEATPCLRCVFPEAPPPGATPTCDTAGVLASVVAFAAHHQVTQAIKWITGNIHAIDRSLISFDLWRNDFRRLDVQNALRNDCPCCAKREFMYLEGDASDGSTSLCGRTAVQINPNVERNNGERDSAITLDLRALRERLAAHGEFTANRFLLRGQFANERGDKDRALELTVFPDGRAIVTGTTEPARARTIYDKYVGG